MRHLLAFLWSGLFFFSTAFAGDTNNSSLSHSFESSLSHPFEVQDLLLLILQDVDFNDIVATSMITKPIRNKVLAIFLQIYPNGLPIDAHNAQAWSEAFRKITAIKDSSWSLSIPLHLKGKNEGELGPINGLLTKFPCLNSSNITFDLEGADFQSNLETLAAMIKSRPQLKVILIKASERTWVEMPLACAQEIGQAQNLQSCKLINLHLGSDAINALGASTSLKVLEFNRSGVVPDKDITLPKNLVKLNIMGENFHSQMMSSIGDLSYLSSCKLNSWCGLDKKSVDISDSVIKLVSITPIEIDIEGHFSLNNHALHKIINNNAERTHVSMQSDQNQKDVLRLSLGAPRPNHENFNLALPYDKLVVAAAIITTKLKQGKRLYVSFFDYIFIKEEKDQRDVPLMLQINKHAAKLKDMILLLDNSIKFEVRFLDAKDLDIDETLLAPILSKQWQRIAVEGKFSLKPGVFSHVKNQDGGLSIDYKAGKYLSIDKERDFRFGRGFAKCWAEPGNIIDRTIVMDLASIANLNSLSLDGAHNLTAADLSLLAKSFDKIELPFGQALAMADSIAQFAIIDISLHDQKPRLDLNCYSDKVSQLQTPQLTFIGGKDPIVADDLTPLFSQLGNIKTIRLGEEASLSRALAQALKNITSLSKLNVHSIDGDVRADDMPAVSVLVLGVFNKHTATVLAHVPNLKDLYVGRVEGDDHGFISWARAHKHVFSQWMSMDGDRENGFLARAIIVGPIPDVFREMFGQPWMGSASSEHGDEPKALAIPKFSIELSILDSNLTDKDLKALQNQPGLIKLDLRGCLHISTEGLLAIVKNPTLGFLRVRSALNQPEVVQAASNSSTTISFED